MKSLSGFIYTIWDNDLWGERLDQGGEAWANEVEVMFKRVFSQMTKFESNCLYLLVPFEH